jgi:hypothetical protein
MAVFNGRRSRKAFAPVAMHNVHFKFIVTSNPPSVLENNTDVLAPGDGVWAADLDLDSVALGDGLESGVWCADPYLDAVGQREVHQQVSSFPHNE